MPTKQNTGEITTSTFGRMMTKPKINNSSFITNTGIVGVSQVSGIVAALVMSIITARYLGPAGKGQVALVVSAGGLLGQIFCLGFDRAAQYFYASGRLSNKKVLGSWLITLLVGNAVAILLIYPVIALFLMDNFFEGVTRPLLAVSVLICPLYMLRLLAHSMLGGFQDFFRQTWHNLSVYASTITATILGLVVLKYDPFGYVAVFVIIGYVFLIYSFFLLRQVTSLKPEFSLAGWTQMLRYGIKSMLSQIFTLIDLRFDIYIINYFLNSSIVGIYSIASSLANSFCMLTNSVAVVLFPKASALGPEQSKKLTGILCRNTMWLTILFCGLFLLVAQYVVSFVFGEQFASAARAFTFLAPGVAGLVVSRVCFTDCSARGHPGKDTIAAAIAAVITIGLDVFLIPRYGMYGAAIAYSAACITGGVMGLYWHMKLSGNKLSDLILPKTQDLKYYVDIWNRLRKKIGLFQKTKES